MRKLSKLCECADLYWPPEVRHYPHHPNCRIEALRGGDWQPTVAEFCEIAKTFDGIGTASARTILAKLGVYRMGGAMPGSYYVNIKNEVWGVGGGRYGVLSEHDVVAGIASIGKAEKLDCPLPSGFRSAVGLMMPASQFRRRCEELLTGSITQGTIKSSHYSLNDGAFKSSNDNFFYLAVRDELYYTWSDNIFNIASRRHLNPALDVIPIDLVPLPIALVAG